MDACINNLSRSCLADNHAALTVDGKVGIGRVRLKQHLEF